MTQSQPIPLETYRCRKCGRIIVRAALASGTVLEIKCKCNQVNIVAA